MRNGEEGAESIGRCMAGLPFFCGPRTLGLSPPIPNSRGGGGAAGGAAAVRVIINLPKLQEISFIDGAGDLPGTSPNRN